MNEQMNEWLNELTNGPAIERTGEIRKKKYKWTNERPNVPTDNG